MNTAATESNDPRSAQRLSDRHAVLTGAGGGIGTAVVAAYLREGPKCRAVDLANQLKPFFRKIPWLPTLAH